MHRPLGYGERVEAGNSLSLYAVREFTAFNRFLDFSKSTVMVPMSVGGGVFIMVIMRMHAATNSANPAACVGVEV